MSRAFVTSAFALVVGAAAAHAAQINFDRIAKRYSSYERSATAPLSLQYGLTGGQVLFAGDGSFIATREYTGSIRLWSRHGRRLLTRPGETSFLGGRLWAVSDGKVAAVNNFGIGMSVHVCGPDNPSYTASIMGFALSDRISSIALSPDGNVAYVGLDNGDLRGMRNGGARVFQTKAHGQAVTALACSGDGAVVATGSADGAIRLFGPSGGTIANWAGAHEGAVTHLAFGPQNGPLVSIGADGVVRVIAKNGSGIAQVKPPKRVRKALLSADAKRLFTCDGGPEITIWSLEGSRVGTIADTAEVSDIAISPDGETLVSNTMALWKTDGSPIRRFRKSELRGGDTFMASDGSHIVVRANGTVNVWSRDCRLVETFDEGNGVITMVPGTDSQSLTLIGYRPGHDWDSEAPRVHPYMRIVDFHGRTLHELSGTGSRSRTSWAQDGKPAGQTICPCIRGKDVTACSDRIVMVQSGDFFSWSPSEGTITSKAVTAHVPSWFSLTASPDGKRVVVAGGPGTVITDPTGEVIQRFPEAGHGGALTADGAHLAIASNRALTLIDLASGGSKKIAIGEPSAELSAPGLRFVAQTELGALAFIGEGGDARARETSVATPLAVTAPGHPVKSGIADGGRLAITGYPDGRCVVTNLLTGDELTLSSYGRQWVAYTADGLFDCSPDGGDLVGICLGTECFALDQFALLRNRPDKILGRMGLASPQYVDYLRTRHLKRLRKSGVAARDVSVELVVPSARIGAVDQQGRFASVKCVFASTGRPLAKYSVFVNDVPIFGSAGKPLSGTSQNVVERVELGTGENKVEISCVDSAGAESYRDVVNLKNPTPATGDLWYLAFGVSKYRDAKLNLSYAHKDALDLERQFKAMAGTKGIGKVHTRVLVDEKVTSDAIRDSKAFVQDAEVDDTFVLFIAGHGIHDADAEATYYYLTYESDVTDLKGTAADFDLIEDLLQGIAPRKKLFLMDTCESGEADEKSEAAVFAMAKSRGIRARTTRGISVSAHAGKKVGPRAYLQEQDRYIYNDLVRRSGAIVFSSSRGGEFSYEDDTIANGFFTEEVIKGLAGAADADKSSAVTTDELRAYVAKAVAESTGGAQNPTVDRDNLYAKFVFPVTGQK